jgi:hypothetical protein
MLEDTQDCTITRTPLDCCGGIRCEIRPDDALDGRRVVMVVTYHELWCSFLT